MTKTGTQPMETRLDRIEKSIEGLLHAIAEDRKAIAEDRAAQREAHGKIDAQIAELRDAQKKTDAKLDRLGVLFGSLGIVQGEVAEDLFYRNVENLFENRNLRFDRVLR